MWVAAYGSWLAMDVVRVADTSHAVNDEAGGEAKEEDQAPDTRDLSADACLEAARGSSNSDALGDISR